MEVFISHKDTAKLYVHFLDHNNPKSKISRCTNELIYIRDFEARSRALTGFLII